MRGDHRANGGFGITVHLRDRIDTALELGCEGLVEARLDDVGTGTGGSHRHEHVAFPHGGDSTAAWRGSLPLRAAYRRCSIRKASVPTLPGVKGALLALAGAAVSVLAFPPFGPGWLIVIGVTLFLFALRTASGRRQGLLYGSLYGLGFFGGLIWWLSELGLIAVIPLVIVQGAFLAIYGWWMGRYQATSPVVWLTLATGGWAVMELIRFRLPVGGFTWGSAGYALSDQAWARLGAPLIGTSGWTVLIVAFAATVVLLILERQWIPIAIGVTVLFFVPTMGEAVGSAAGGRASSRVCRWPSSRGRHRVPSPTARPNERLRTYRAASRIDQDHRTRGSVESGGVVGGLNRLGERRSGAETPRSVRRSETEARRIGAWILVGSDRPLDARDLG